LRLNKSYLNAKHAKDFAKHAKIDEGKSLSNLRTITLRLENGFTFTRGRENEFVRHCAGKMSNISRLMEPVFGPEELRNSPLKILVNKNFPTVKMV